MGGYQELLAVLARVRRRWQTMRLLYAVRRTALAACGALLGALLAHWLMQPQAGALVLLWAVAAALVLVLVVAVAVSLASRPRDLQIARLIEERCDELEDSLVTAVAAGAAGHASPMSAAVVHQAVERVGSVDLNRVISWRVLRRTAFVAAAAIAALAVALVFSAPPAGQAVRAAGIYLFPERLGLAVRPGDATVVEGQPFRVVARVSSGVPVEPLLRLTVGSQWRDLPMEPSAEGFTTTVERVDRDFHYVVTAAGATSTEYAVTVLHPPRVEQIDLHYEYPAAFGMKPRDEEDGGDVYGPAGTRVRITVRPTKPVRAARLALTGGKAIPLTWRPDLNALQGDMTIAEDGSYRVALADADGLQNPGDTEYFIRTLQDGPPDVRITRPAADRQVTPLEEISIEAQADDDFGVAALDLVYAVAGGAHTVVPFTRDGSGIAVTGSRMLYLEDLRVKPGDVVSYYARARDVSRGKRASEARSDIFFLEVKPFEEEFVASQSQGAGGGGDEQALEDLIQAQKDVITATWNLDRRGRQAGSQSPDDIRSVSRAQRDVKSGTERMLAEIQRANAIRRRRLPGGRGAATAPDLMAEAMGRAVAAMANAQEQLDGLKTAEALPPEMTSLNELLRAQAEVRRREIPQQGNGTGGPGGNRQQQDMSSLFDRELARQQQTNYETPSRGENRRQDQSEENADRIQDLARRQDALNRSEEQLSKNRGSMPQEELKRELERLTREQSELRREAEELARSMQQNAQSGSGQGGRGSRGGSGSQDQQASRELQQASEDMQHATSELRRDNPQEASARGTRAAERLRELEQRLRGAQPDQRRRALGELELESRQLAEAQRRVSNQSGTAGASPAERDDQARRRASEQERLAGRAERLEQSVRQLAGAGRDGDPRERAAVDQAAAEVDKQRLSQRMREAARPNRQGSDGRQDGEQIARALERLADKLGAAGGEGAASQELSAELSRLRQLREELATLDRRLTEMKNGGTQGRGQQNGRGAQPGGAGQDAGAQQPWNEARELLNEMRREDDSLVPPQADGFNPGRSAPGTEAWKQDFAKWEELKAQLSAALEWSEQTTAERLRQQQSRDRLNAGASQSVPESYRRLVDKYYRALASGK
jgi:hypothetical protein